MPRYCGQCGYDTTTVPVRPGGRLCPECGAVTRGVRARGSLARAALWTSAPLVTCLVATFICFGIGFAFNSEAGVIPFLGGVGAFIWGIAIGITALVKTPARAARFWPREEARGKVLTVVVAAIVLDVLALMVTVFAIGVMGARMID